KREIPTTGVASGCGTDPGATGTGCGAEGITYCPFGSLACKRYFAVGWKHGGNVIVTGGVAHGASPYEAASAFTAASDRSFVRFCGTNTVPIELSREVPFTSRLP